MALVRFIVKNKGKCLGLYQAVDEFCPRDDPRRNNKPDGSWLPRRGPDFPHGVSFWKTAGLRKYIESGLFEWHSFVVPGKLRVYVLSEIHNPLYEDEYQIICSARVLEKYRSRPLTQQLLTSLMA